MSWLYTIDVSDWYHRDELSMSEKGTRMANVLKVQLHRMLDGKDERNFDSELEEIIEAFENITGYDDVTDVEEFDEWMEVLYNWGDSGNTLWINTR